MKIDATVCLMWIHWGVFCQNLVLNPGFDTILACPDAPSQIEYALYWSSATNGTPDLYNECSEVDGITVPYAGHHFDSYQDQRSGGGYALIGVYSNSAAPLEYVKSRLLEDLKLGKTYYVEFYVSPDLDTNTFWCYTDAVGLAFHSTSYYQDLMPNEALSLEPAIENRGMLITDTMGWTRICGCYIANGDERYAIIGNFRSTSETQIAVEDPNVFPYSSRFYIEDVRVQLFDPLPDTILLCPGEQRTLNAGFLDGTYLWSSGEQDSLHVIESPGMYSVEVFMPNCVLRDTVIVLQVDDSADFPTEIVICSDEEVVLQAPVYGEYEWSTGDWTISLPIHTEGEYSVTVDNSCGRYVFDTRVFIEECGCNLYIPNVMTPNQDGINDEMEVNLYCDFPSSVISFELYDRWGNAVYTAYHTEHIVWEGTSKDGRYVPSGVYVWRLGYTTFRHGAEKMVYAQGDITVLY